MRSKRLFILFMVLMTFVVFGGAGIRKTLSVTRQIDKEVQKIENVYNSVAEEDIDINITDSVKGVFSELGIKGMIIVVERRFYDKSQLDSIVETWQMQLW